MTLMLNSISVNSKISSSDRGGAIKQNPYCNMHNDKSLDGARKSHLILAIYGLVEIESRNYLLVVTDGQPAVNIADHIVFKATKFQFIPLSCDQSDFEQDFVRIELTNARFNFFRNSSECSMYSWTGIAFTSPILWI